MSLTISEAIDRTNQYFTDPQYVDYKSLHLKTIIKLYNQPAVKKLRDVNLMSLYFECQSYDVFIDFQSDMSKILLEINKNCPFKYTWRDASTVYRILGKGKPQPILSVDLAPSFIIVNNTSGYNSTISVVDKTRKMLSNVQIQSSVGSLNKCDKSTFKILQRCSLSNGQIQNGDLHADRPSSMDGAVAGKDIAPPDLEVIPVEPNHVPQQVKSYSVWPNDLFTASCAMLQCPSMPILIPVNSTANTIIDIVSLGELSKMTRPMRIWAGAHTYSTATQVVQYGFKTAMTIINDLVIGLAAERKSSYEVDELQIINWRDLNPVENTISIDLKLAAVSADMNIPNRYQFVETVSDGTLIPTIVLMTRIPVQNTYANDNVSINIIRSSKFKNETSTRSAFIFTADNLAAGNLASSGLASDAQAFTSKPTAVSNLLRLDPSRPFNITLDGAFGDAGMSDPALNNTLNFPTQLNLRYYSSFQLPEYATANTRSDGYYRVSISTKFGSEQTIPCIRLLAPAVTGRTFTTTLGTNIQISSPTVFLASGYGSTTHTTTAQVHRSGIGAMGAVLPSGVVHLQELSGLDLPESSFDFVNASLSYTNGAISTYTTSYAVNIDLTPDLTGISTIEQQNNILDRLISDYVSGGWNVTFKEILTPVGTGGRETDQLFVNTFSTSTTTIPYATRQSLGDNNGTVSAYNTTGSVASTYSVTTSVVQLPEAVNLPLQTSHLITLAHPTKGSRNILVWSRYIPTGTSTGNLLNVNVPMATTGYMHDYSYSNFASPSSSAYSRGTGIYNSHFHQRFPLDNEFNLQIIKPLDFTSLPTRAITINNQNSFTLDSETSRLNFPLTLPTTLTTTIASSLASSEVTDSVFLYAWRNFIRASNLEVAGSFVYFTLWNRLSTQPLAYCAYSIDYQTFFVRNNPSVDADLYKVYPKSTTEDVLIGNVQLYNSSVGLAFSTITSRWTSRVVADTNTLQAFDGFKLSQPKQKTARIVGSRVQLNNVQIQMEAGAAIASGAGGMFTGLAQIFAQILGSNQMDNRLKMYLQNQLDMLSKQHENNKDMAEFNATLNGLKSGINQRTLTTAGSSTPMSFVPQTSQQAAESSITADPTYQQRLDNYNSVPPPQNNENPIDQQTTVAQVHAPATTNIPEQASSVTSPPQMTNTTPNDRNSALNSTNLSKTFANFGTYNGRIKDSLRGGFGEKVPWPDRGNFGSISPPLNNGNIAEAINPYVPIIRPSQSRTVV